MDGPTVTSDGVLLVYRLPLGGSAEIHAYFQAHEGVLKAHLRLVTIKKDGSVSYTQRGIAVPPNVLTDLLKATAALAVEKERIGV
jgi:hypothetical protein